jgi:hypothetical protein
LHPCEAFHLYQLALQCGQLFKFSYWPRYRTQWLQ